MDYFTIIFVVMFHSLGTVFLLTGDHKLVAFILLDGKLQCLEAVSLHTENNLISSNAQGDHNSWVNSVKIPWNCISNC